MAIDVGIVLIDDASNQTSICASRFDFPGLIPKKRAVVIASMGEFEMTSEKKIETNGKNSSCPFSQFCLLEREKEVREKSFWNEVFTENNNSLGIGDRNTYHTDTFSLLWKDFLLGRRIDRRGM